MIVHYLLEVIFPSLPVVFLRVLQDPLSVISEIKFLEI